MSDISNKGLYGSLESLNTISTDTISIDFSIETVSSDNDIVETWNTNNESDNRVITEEENLEILRISIIDITLQDDIENLDLISIDEINNLSPSDLIDYKNHLLDNHDIIPADLVNMVNTHLFIIN